jgi:hypothetical protein
MSTPTSDETLKLREHRRAIDTAIATIAMLLGVKLAPGHGWRIAYKKRTVVYPLRELLAGTFQHAVMRLWQAASHVLNSHGKLDLYDVVVDTTLDIALEVGRRTTRPDWLMPLVAVAERERAETIARKAGRSLAQRQLPPRGTSFRSDDRKSDIELISRPISTEATFWEVAAAAVQGLVSKTLEPEDLAIVPLPWGPGIVDSIRATTAAPSYDALIEMMQPILVDIAIARAEELGEPQSETGEGDPTENPDEDESGEEESSEENGSGNSGCGPSEGQSNSRKSDSSAPDKTKPSDPSANNDSSENQNGPGQPKSGEQNEHDAGGSTGAEESSDETNGQPSNTTKAAEKSPHANEKKTRRLTIIFSDETGSRIDAEVAEDPGRADIEYAGEIIIVIPGGLKDLETDEALAEIIMRLTPEDLSWAAVSRSNEHITRPIERVISEYLTENEIGEVERGTRSGMLDIRQISQPDTSTAPPFKRRAVPDDHSYDVALVVDRSGSMCHTTDSAEDPATFGTFSGMRWHLACRMVVGLVESLQHMPDTRTAVVLYDHNIDVMKTFDQQLTDSLKDEIIRKTVARGNNDDAGALQTAINQFATSQADRRMIVYLTDGEFCSDASAVRNVLTRCAANDIELVFLIVGQRTEHILRFVPAHLADEITPETISSVLAKHVTRMLGDLSYA